MLGGKAEGITVSPLNAGHMIGTFSVIARSQRDISTSETSMHVFLFSHARTQSKESLIHPADDELKCAMTLFQAVLCGRSQKTAKK
jgi:hypothetical protein